MDPSGSANDHLDKPKCPYGEKCYRKNPVHFREMSHPHLERLVENQLVGDIVIPENLDFPCDDMEALMEQLKVLQMVLGGAAQDRPSVIAHASADELKPVPRGSRQNDNTSTWAIPNRSIINPHLPRMHNPFENPKQSVSPILFFSEPLILPEPMTPFPRLPEDPPGYIPEYWLNRKSESPPVVSSTNPSPPKSPADSTSESSSNSLSEPPAESSPKASSSSPPNQSVSPSKQSPSAPLKQPSPPPRRNDDISTWTVPDSFLIKPHRSRMQNPIENSILLVPPPSYLLEPLPPLPEPMTPFPRLPEDPPGYIPPYYTARESESPSLVSSTNPSFPGTPAASPLKPSGSSPHKLSVSPPDKTTSVTLKRPSPEAPRTSDAKKIKSVSPSSASNTSKSPSRSPSLAAGTPRTDQQSTSIIDNYVASDSQKARDEVRTKAMLQMIKAGEKMPYLGVKGQFDMKYALAAPYCVFLPAVQDSPETWDQPFTVTLPEVLDVSLGEIEESLHMNFMVDVGWLCLQYLMACQPAKMLILLGNRTDSVPLPDTIKIVTVQPPNKYGLHHSKISILKYKNGLRIIISTANLYTDDWQNRTQALWISPHLSELPDGSSETDGESRTGFKADFLSYLGHYRVDEIQPWVALLKKTDFSDINVFFVGSVPGSHSGANRDKWGLRKLGVLLSKHAELPEDAAKWPVVCQSSSIGSLGNQYDSWIGNQVVSTMAMDTRKGLRSMPNFQFIYPTLQNYMDSFDMMVGSCCLPHNQSNFAKQRWLANYLYQWKSDGIGRTKAMPHIKCYTRISPDQKRIPWMVITSANLSKAAWGHGQNSHTILSYEAGVVFFPKFLIDSTTFPLGTPDENGNPPFPLAYDLPLTPYAPQDEIFTLDHLTREQ